MAIQFVASSTGTADQATSVTVNKPTGVVGGDFLVALVVGIVDTPPTGWTQQLAGTNGNDSYVYTKVAGASEPASYTWPHSFSGTDRSATVVAYRGVDTTAPVDVSAKDTSAANDVTLIAPSVTTTGENRTVVCLYELARTTTLTVPSGTTSRAAIENVSGVNSTSRVVDYPQSLTGATGTTTSTAGDSGRWDAYTVALVVSNDPPNAPVLTFPTSVTINLAQTTRFDWDFSDVDTDDAQSQFQLQLRPQLSTTNTVDVTSETVNTFYDLAGSTLTAGDYEWRVRTWDSQGEDGPYSSWTPFTAAAAPSGPSITDPVNGQTITTETYTVKWSAAEQDAYQLRKVADSAGAPATGTVYFDTGTVTSSTARSRSVAFDTNNRTEHVQVRVQRNTLWSDWTSVSVDVSYTSPETPTLAVSDTAVTGGVQLQASHPTPGVGVPTVESVDLERRITGETGSLRIATGLAPTAVYVDWSVASGVTYEYQARAYGDNGTSSYGAWTA